MTRRDHDRPRLAATYADHIALDLGQVELDYPWSTPDGVAGTTMSETGISDGESLNPPKVQVHVYSGMEFRREDGTWFEFDKATYWGFRAEQGSSEPNPECYLNEVDGDDRLARVRSR